jgi:hypothetical protein
MTYTAFAKQTKKPFWMGMVRVTYTKNGYWIKTSGITRLNKWDALQDADNMALDLGLSHAVDSHNYKLNQK